jgi:hypothetical protein
MKQQFLKSLACSHLFTLGNYDNNADLQFVLTEAETGKTKNALSKLFPLFMLNCVANLRLCKD